MHAHTHAHTHTHTHTHAHTHIHVSRTKKIEFEIITTAKISNKFSRESPYISNTFSRESPKFQTSFHVSTRSPRHSKDPSLMEIYVYIWWIFGVTGTPCTVETDRPGDPNILSGNSPVSGLYMYMICLSRLYDSDFIYICTHRFCIYALTHLYTHEK